MFDKNQFKNLIQNVLQRAELHSDSAENLLLGTAAQESQFGTYLRQINGPALGVFQMEPATEFDIWENFLFYNKILKNRIYLITGISGIDNLALEGNLIYQIVMCRMHYFRVKESLPESWDINGLARYWKQYYNTLKGRGTEEKFVENYKRYVL